MSEPRAASESEERIRGVLASYFATLNAEDWDGLAALFHDEAELRAPGIRALKGVADVSGYFRAALRPYPIHRDEPTRILVCGSTATVEIHYEGKLANGKPLCFDAVDVFDFKDGLIHRLSSWYDSHRVRSDLREATQPASRDLWAGR
ncbi:MAG: nuclear transport factor 2 family protein [Solirubrobacteraceae bacterium]